MDTLSNLFLPNSPPRPPNERMVADQMKVWPLVPAAEGKFYGSTDKFGAKLIVMTQGTWEQLGNIIESSRTTLRGQDDALKKQSMYIQELTAERNDLLQRLTTLRGSHRELLKERVEAGMAPMAPAPDHVSDYLGNAFNPTSKGPSK